jgi:subtilisin family serine protease
VAAPSADVFIVVPVYMKDVHDMSVAGTSLSAPLVAGVVALLRSAAPPPAGVLAEPGSYCRLVSECLTKTARLDILGLQEPDDVVGHGLVDAFGALQMIRKLF